MKNMLAQKNGFTIVELIIIIIVISILTAIGTYSFMSVQQQARDNSRSTNATLIAEALEKYYEKNGEYPSPSLLINSRAANTGVAVAAVLSVDQKVLVAPQAANGVTNSIAANASYSTYGYSANSPSDDAGCQITPTIGCDSYTLSYIQESDDATITLRSRGSGISRTGTEGPITPSSSPTIQFSGDGSSSTPLVATASSVTCAAGQAQYKIDTATTAAGTFDYNWSNGSWTTGRTSNCKASSAT